MKEYLLLVTVLVAMGIGGYFVWRNRQSIKPGMIIFLNGSSSSGKTSIAKELQKMFDVPLLHMGIDNFLLMMPREKKWFERMSEQEYSSTGPGFTLVDTTENDKPMIRIEFGPWGEKLVTGMYEAIAAMVSQGFSVIVDDVVQRKESLECAVRSFKPFKTYFIGVKCPIKILEKREKERGDRAITMARGMYKRVHSFSSYDFEVDTSQYTPQECAEKIKDFMDTYEPEIFKKLV